MRTVSPAAATVLAGKLVPMALLVEMDLSSPLNLNTSPLNLDINGATYLSTRGLGKITALADTPAEARGISFELSAARLDNIALARTERVQGQPVRIKTAIFDPTTYRVVDVRLRWAGALDVMTISHAPGAATISASAEHIGIDLTRPSTSLLSDAEQRRLAPGDLFLQYLGDQVDQNIVWPTAEFFRK